MGPESVYQVVDDDRGGDAMEVYEEVDQADCSEDNPAVGFTICGIDLTVHEGCRMYWVASAMPDQYWIDSNVCQQEHSSDIVEHIPRGSAARQSHTGRRVEVKTTSPRLYIASVIRTIRVTA